METIEQILSGWAREAFQKRFPDVDLRGLPLDVQPTVGESFGDYQCNAAMALAKEVGQKPREVAQAVLEGLPPPSCVHRAEVAGPGFINLFLDDAWLTERLEASQADEGLGVPDVGQGATVIIDYSSPNVAKPMHVAHLRSTVIGNALDRMHRAVGFRVIADNHLGDWGTQFGILIQGYRHFVDEEALEADAVAELERVYVLSNNKAKDDEEWLGRAREELVKLQQGDAENRLLWARFVELSLKAFNEIYDRLDVRFDLVRGESFYHDGLAPLVDRLKAAGLAEESDGALVVPLDDEDLPVCIVRKRDGGFNYATTDLVTIEERVREFSPEAIIYVTDERQQLHFKQVFAVARRLGVRVPLVHTWFGLMRSEDGSPFAGRAGNVIKLGHLLDEAEKRALDLVKASSPQMPVAQQVEVARAIGVGAIKYMDLSQNPQTNVTFTWEKALSLEGNSAPYLQYAYARIASVRDKYMERFGGRSPDACPLQLGHPQERRLALHLLRFPGVLVRATLNYRPNLLADYLYELAQSYSTFYQTVPFLKAEEGVRESRVRLCIAVARVLRQGLALLGIESPERV